MNGKAKRSGSQMFQEWFTRNDEEAGNQLTRDISDSTQVLNEEGLMDNGRGVLKETDSCCLSQELRIFIGTWNVGGRSPLGSLAVDLDEWLNLRNGADMYVLGFQEVVPLKTQNVIGVEDTRQAKNWNLLIAKALNYRYGCPWLAPMLNHISSSPRAGSLKRERSRRTQDENLFGESKYKLLASKKMVGVFLSVWIRNEVFRRFQVSDVKFCPVACGLMGYLGNKGSISISLSIEGTSYCFITAHLASGEKKGDEGKRNHQVLEIFRRTRFPRSSRDETRPLTILAHDRIFWFGDLNYRLCMEDDLARRLVQRQDWKALQRFDQLRREQEEGGVFQGWTEGDIEFPPTYKYCSLNFDRYSGGLASRTGEKQRTPAWCDRILWNGKGVKQLSYSRSESRFSDHRPVSALFSTHVEARKHESSRVTPMQNMLLDIVALEQADSDSS
ncbi:PREDICTED: type IV inositol polyphosphate 5-phosphatase 7-like [Tarenaya hassleriana]|uniref:type IV inositol polyphosphate 5-phosphatase 7-like n=1 Tax=Tarenaya hassleriana TaxID=28532 RepID=UPI00053C08B0|nr:PREDICTED: type IV inositol polyphosphate 5-phosphatase 7-like [Tarenaya hassleriana]